MHKTPSLDAAHILFIPRRVDFSVEVIVVIRTTLRGNQALQRLHTVERGAEALPHFPRFGTRQKRGGRLTIPDARDRFRNFDRSKSEPFFLELLEFRIWKGTVGTARFAKGQRLFQVA